jgi:CrcB protein
VPADPQRRVDPDVDLHIAADRGARQAPVLAVVAVGGALGAAARYGLAQALPHGPGGFPWATFAINTGGCLLIGVLIVAVTEVWDAHPLTRPFLGTGVLGGFTTFSTYAVDALTLAGAGHPRRALLYGGLTLLCALAAAAAGMRLTRALASARIAS